MSLVPPIGRALYLIAPALAAGVLHAAVLKWNLAPWLARPLDGGRLWRGRPLLGEAKTWRGLVVMAAGCTGAALALGLAAGLGVALGLGYSLAELPNSFVKRRAGIGSGRRSRRFAALQYLGDQGDSVAGGTLAVALFVDAPAVLAAVFGCGLVLHVVFDRLLYAAGVKGAVNL